MPTPDAPLLCLMCAACSWTLGRQVGEDFLTGLPDPLLARLAVRVNNRVNQLTAAKGEGR